MLKANNNLEGTQGNKIKVGVVNYLNTRPLLYGLEKLPIREQMDLIGDYPSRLGELLKNDEIDLGLVPVAIIPELPEYHIVGNYCIGTEGEIASVALFSEVPIDNIERIYLDYQSRTSVELLKFLIRESWGISPELVQSSSEDYRHQIKGSSAGLVIGDRAFEQRKISTFFYDLGSEWRSITGLPFVFAAWISKKELDSTFISDFDKANSIGLTKIDEIVQGQHFNLFDLKKYYTLHLSYQLDERKLKGLELFLNIIRTNN